MTPTVVSDGDDAPVAVPESAQAVREEAEAFSGLSADVLLDELSAAPRQEP